MILRFEPTEAGDGLSVSDPGTDPAAKPAESPPLGVASTMIGLRLLTDDLPSAGPPSFSEHRPATEPAPASPRTRRVIVHKAHAQTSTHHLRVYEPADSRAAKRPKAPATRS